MRLKRRKRLTKRRWASSKGVIGFSDRSGMPFKYKDMIEEPGTNVWLHKSESDGQWNITQAYKDPVVPPDAQSLEKGRNVPAEAVEAVTQLDLSGFFEE